MSAMVPFEQPASGAMAKAFASQPLENELAAGIDGGYAVIKYKGKVWSIHYNKTETKLMRDDPADPGPRGSIEVVILKSAAHKSKTYFERWVEGSTEPPVCFSNSGITPDPKSKVKQHPTCAGCPKNVFGSRITDDGRQAKACSDSKRLAVVPLNDIANEAMGGPMLLRVPAASLRELLAYGDQMRGLGYHSYAIGTRISFDPESASPKFKFNGIRALSEAEAAVVLKLRDDPRTNRVLSEDEHAMEAPAPAQVQLNRAFEQPPAAPAPQPAPQIAAPQPAPVTPAVTTVAPPAPAPQANGGGADFDQALDGMLAKLMPAE